MKGLLVFEPRLPTRGGASTRCAQSSWEGRAAEGGGACYLDSTKLPSVTQLRENFKLQLRLKLQYFGHLIEELTDLNNLDAGKDCRLEKVREEDEMVGWHHQLNGHEFEQAPGA